jgi:hypothetical protein
MRMRMVILASLGILLVQSAALSQPQPYGGTVEPNVPGSGEVVTVLAVKCYPVQPLAEILENLFGGEGTHIMAAGNASRLIVQASPQRMNEIVQVVRELDVPDVSQPAAQSLTCRMYMLENPVKGPGGRPFAVVLHADAPVSSQALSEATKGEDLQITELTQADVVTPDGTTQRIEIKGLAVNDEVVGRMITKIPHTKVEQVKLGDEMSTPALPVAQPSELPEPLKQHIYKFLGQDVHTVGYWFGNVSFPGEVTAPIGPWTFYLRGEPVQAGDVHLVIEVRQQPLLGSDRRVTILSNSLQGRIGKPIIIGYNRDLYGTRTMGALIILPETDPLPAAQSKESR